MRTYAISPVPIAGPARPGDHILHLTVREDEIVLYVGVSENARNEVRSIQAKDARLVTILPEYEKSIVVEGAATRDGQAAGQTMDLSTKEGVQAFCLTLGKAGESIRTLFAQRKFDPDTIDARWGSARRRVFYGRIAATFAQAETGQASLTRLVLSGHHLPRGDALFANIRPGGGDHEIDFATLGSIVRMFPTAAGQVKHLMLSACRSLGGSEALQLRQFFPRLSSVWGYIGTSPNAAEDNRGETSTQHIQAWIDASSRASDRLAAEAKKWRHARVLQGDEIYRLQTFQGDAAR